jgi:hypothetical protein
MRINRLMRLATLSILFFGTHTTEAAELRAAPIEPPPLDSQRSPSSHLVPWLASNGLYGYADREGVLRIQPRFTAARPFYEGFAAVSVKDRWGFIQASGTFQIAPKYAEVSDFLDGKARAFTHNEAIDFPIFGVTVGAVLWSGTTSEYLIDRHGTELKKNSRSENVLQRPGPEERRFARQPRPSYDKSDWQEVLLVGRSVLRRSSDGREFAKARWMTIVRDALTGAPTLFAGHDDGKPWSVWDLDGKLIANSPYDVYKFASEGRFCAEGGRHGWWAAFDYDGHRLTPYFGSEPFFFRDGIAEVEATQGGVVYADVSGRLYVDQDYLENTLQAPWKNAPPSNPFWRP